MTPDKRLATALERRAATLAALNALDSAMVAHLTDTTGPDVDEES